ncbi:phosphoribosylaminoimidazolesuccinocarboxamide synthase [Methanogenium sp. MK-MG]|uniref:phosphoribosylaminoimidazolesuccinocarboxamide synthase n=1 Tax=Methanogenium sp. MK-MG TaxID=2599926 RepID=UPI0013EC2D93|nr:phosphoribosylaminoimidazolesuccinocarboxamide synthase [Methanogenium sp. MK-MG]KAF1076670.1 Phosphoribosylaminoimidazole-succinocarboxamide synthase [Methanogenium sp. MK-MG]
MDDDQLLYEGKAKSVFRTNVAGELRVVFRDDITAFNGGKKDILAGKGAYNARVSAFFFEYLEKNGIPTHFIRMEDERTMIVRELTMIPLEVIARNVAAGSIVKKFPFTEGQRIDPPVIVTDYKDDEHGDPSINDDLIIALGFLSPDDLREVRETTLKINTLLKDFFTKAGIELVDFKIEFGRSGDTICLGDEISMDSMRLWDLATGESLDKDVYRFGKGDVLSAYGRVVDKILQEN